jgi:DNA-binding SARP family transcriptional activator
VLEPLLTRDASDKHTHRELMHPYALDGRRRRALRQYQACVGALAVELESPPDPETEGLYVKSLGGEIGPSPASTAKTTWRPPAPIASEVEQSGAAVGRKDELERLRARLHIRLAEPLDV